MVMINIGNNRDGYRKGHQRNVHAFDIDGVVTDASYLGDIIKKEFPNFKYTDLTQYDVGESLIKGGYIKNEEEYKALNFFQKYEKELCLEAPLTEGFQEYYERLLNSGHEVHFVTARPSSQYGITKEYFKKHGIYVTSEKIHLVGSTEKEKVLKDLRPQFFYEDNAETMIRMMKQNHVGSGIIVGTPYNNHNFSGYDIIRVENMKDLLLK